MKENWKCEGGVHKREVIIDTEYEFHRYTSRIWWILISLGRKTPHWSQVFENWFHICGIKYPDRLYWIDLIFTWWFFIFNKIGFSNSLNFRTICTIVSSDLHVHVHLEVSKYLVCEWNNCYTIRNTLFWVIPWSVFYNGY